VDCIDLWAVDRIDGAAALGRLPGLTTLKLQASELPGNLTFLNQLRQLGILWLGGLTRGVNDLSALAELAQLKKLYLFDNPESVEPTMLRTLSRLVLLRATHHGQGGELRALIDCLTDLPDFRNLYLSNCRTVTDITPLARLRRLTGLQLADASNLDDIATLAQLPDLKLLDLTNGLALHDLSVLAELAGLQVLSLGGCAALQDISPLAGLRTLKRKHSRSRRPRRGCGEAMVGCEAW